MSADGTTWCAIVNPAAGGGRSGKRAPGALARLRDRGLRIDSRFRPGETSEDFVRRVLEIVAIVVAIDPAVSTGTGACETGIIVVAKGRRGRFYVLEDCSVTMSQIPAGALPERVWAQRAMEAAWRWRADWITAEVNNGGNLVAGDAVQLLRDLPVRPRRAAPAGVLPGRPRHEEQGPARTADCAALRPEPRRARRRPAPLPPARGSVLHVRPPPPAR